MIVVTLVGFLKRALNFQHPAQTRIASLVLGPLLGVLGFLTRGTFGLDFASTWFEAIIFGLTAAIVASGGVDVARDIASRGNKPTPPDIGTL